MNLTEKEIELLRDLIHIEVTKSRDAAYLIGYVDELNALSDKLWQMKEEAK